MAESNEIVFVIRLKEAFTQVAKQVNDGFGRIEAAGRKASASFIAVQKSSQSAELGLGKLTGVLTRLAAAYASVAAANKAINVAQGQAETEQRLSNALRGNADLLEKRKAAIADLASKTTFSRSNVTEAEALLRTFGVSDSQIDIALKAVVNRAAAFNTSLEEQARQFGIVFSTGLAGELGEREAGIRNLTESARRAGDGFKLLADKYAGFAQGLAGGDFGKAAQQANQLNDAIGKIGAALVNLKTRALDQLLPPLKKVADFFEAINSIGLERVADGFVAQFKTIYNVVVGFIGDLFDYLALKLDAFTNRVAAVILNAVPDDGKGTFSAAAESSFGVASLLDQRASRINFTANARDRLDAGNAEADAAAKTAAQLEARLRDEQRVNEAMIQREKIQKDITELEAKALVTADKTTQQLDAQRKLLADSAAELAGIQKKLPGLFSEERGSAINPSLTSEINTLLARKAQLEATINQANQAIRDLRVQQVRDTLDRGEKALSLYNQSVQSNANLVSAGSLTGSQAQLLNGEALDRLKVKVLETAVSVRGAIADGVLSQQDADELGQRLVNLEGSIPRIATEAEKFSSDLRDGLQSPFEGFFQTILSGTASVKKAFQSLAADILSSIEKLLANRLAQSFLNFLGGGLFGTDNANGGPQSKGLLGGVGGFFSSLLNPLGGLFKLFGFAGGGIVPGSGTGDSVPAMLTPGEFVLPRRAVSAIGAGQLEAIRRTFAGFSIVPPPSSPSFSVPQHFAAGGMVGGGSSGSSSGQINVLTAIVADDQRMERMLKGGRAAVISFLGRNSVEVRNALGL